MTQHAGLDAAAWARHAFSRQVLMIANEMHRAGKLDRPDDGERRQRAYERVLRLADLTLEVNSRRGLRRELLRWREQIGELWLLAPSTCAKGQHRALFHALLLMSPESARQRAFVLGPSPAPTS